MTQYALFFLPREVWCFSLRGGAFFKQFEALGTGGVAGEQAVNPSEGRLTRELNLSCVVCVGGEFTPRFFILAVCQHVHERWSRYQKPNYAVQITGVFNSQFAASHTDISASRQRLWLGWGWVHSYLCYGDRIKPQHMIFVFSVPIQTQRVWTVSCLSQWLLSQFNWACVTGRCTDTVYLNKQK